jgi:hypothetical protein
MVMDLPGSSCAAGVDSKSGHLCCPGNLFLGPSKAAEPDNNAVPVCFLPGTDISDPDIDGLPDNTQFFCQGRFSISAFRV